MFNTAEEKIIPKHGQYYELSLLKEEMVFNKGG